MNIANCDDDGVYLTFGIFHFTLNSDADIMLKMFLVLELHVF